MVTTGCSALDANDLHLERKKRASFVIYDVTSSGLITFKSQKFNIKSDDKGQITTVKGKADSLSLRPK